MNRRRFLQFTIALAAAAVVPASVLDAARETTTKRWVPVQAQVDEWLQWYKLTTDRRHKRFVDIALYAFPDEPESTVAEGEAEHRLFSAAEGSFEVLQQTREAVADAQGRGYIAGRDGLPRFSGDYVEQSSPGFAWYNGWNVGFNDRLGRVTPA